MLKALPVKKSFSFKRIRLLTTLSILLTLSAHAGEEEIDTLLLSYNQNGSCLLLEGLTEQFEHPLFTKEEIESLMKDQEDQSSIPSLLTLSDCEEIPDSGKISEEQNKCTQIYTDFLTSLSPVKSSLLEGKQEVSSSPSSTKIIIQYLNPFPLIIRNNNSLPQPINTSPYHSQTMLSNYSVGNSSSSPFRACENIKKNEVPLKKLIQYTFIKETPMIKKSQKKKKRTEWKFHDYSDKSFC